MFGLGTSRLFACTLCCFRLGYCVSDSCHTFCHTFWHTLTASKHAPSPTLSPTDPVPRAPTDPECRCWRSILTPWPMLSATGMNTLTPTPWHMHMPTPISPSTRGCNATTSLLGHTARHGCWASLAPRDYSTANCSCVHAHRFLAACLSLAARARSLSLSTAWARRQRTGQVPGSYRGVHGQQGRGQLKYAALGREEKAEEGR